MEFSTTAIGLMVLGLAIAPFVLLQWDNQRKRKQRLLYFNMLCRNQDVLPDLFDLWSDKAIGLDSALRRLIYVDFQHGETPEIIELRTMQKCELLQKKEKEGDRHITTHLAIVLTGRDQSKHILEFYNADTDLGQNGEWPLVQKWCAYIKEKI